MARKEIQGFLHAANALGGTVHTLWGLSFKDPVGKIQLLFLGAGDWGIVARQGQGMVLAIGFQFFRAQSERIITAHNKIIHKTGTKPKWMRLKTLSSKYANL